jgi:polysaccharide export outer membrane protein
MIGRIGAHIIDLAGKIIVLFCVCINLGIAQTNEYRISPGDSISIQVYGEADLSLSSIPIPHNGIINYPFLGKVQASEKTEIELASDIANRLREGFLLDPQVTVTIVGYRRIYIGGAIAVPGHKTFFVNMNVEKIIEISGGFAKDADQSSIILLREDESGEREIKADLKTELRPGDILTIGRLSKRDLEGNLVETKRYYYLYGEVRKPGRYEYIDNLSVEKAIVIAGGFGNRASKRKITVTRGTPAVKKKKAPLDYPIMPGDIISVGVSLF